MFSFLEKSVFKRGYRIVAGIDEAGRGPLAGPVAAAAVAVNKDVLANIRRDCFVARLWRFPRNDKIVIRDSKCLSAKQREEIFEALKDIPGLEWRVSFVQPKTIDRINIWQATLLAWRRCLKKLSIAPDFLFLDGNMAIPRLKIKQSPIVKGDQKIFLVSLASIIAKVSRDRLMDKLDRKYPEYGFSQHKGYGTKLHLERLEKFGPCPIHRRSFKPVFDNLSFCDKVYYAVGRIPRGQITNQHDFD